MSNPQYPDPHRRYQPDQQPSQSPYQPYQPYQIQYSETYYGGQSAERPGPVLAIGIMAIVDAVISGMSSLIWMITICGIPLGIYSIAVAIIAGIYAYRLLGTSQPVQPNKTLAIMQIVNLITGNIFSLAFGIISLVFYDQPQVRGYFAQRNGQPQPPTQCQPPSF